MKPCKCFVCRFCCHFMANKVLSVCTE